MAAKKKKWAAKAWSKVEKGSLTRIGWPNGAKIAAYVRANPGKYASVIRKLLLIANASKAPSAKAKAKSIISQLQKSRPKKKK